MSSSSKADSASDSQNSNDNLVHDDIENTTRRTTTKRRRPVVEYLKQVFWTKRETRALAWLLLLSCIAIATSIIQAIYISKLKAGLVRIANDPFDNHFHEINHDSSAIWTTERQNFIHQATPVPVHSHNDYWRRIPLFEALGSGCISVEADVHLKDNNLLIGHTSFGLNRKSSLQKMYLEPLQRMLEAQNEGVASDMRGIFNVDPSQTVVLLVDFKTSDAAALTLLHRQLEPLRQLEYLTYWNGAHRINRPLTIVASGSASFDQIVTLTPSHRDIFWDAKLERLQHIEDDFSVSPPRYGYNISNCYYASTRWSNARLWSWYWSADGTSGSATPPDDVYHDIGASQIEQAGPGGLLSRYWDVPSSPNNIQEIAWRVLVERKVDVLNMDDLGTVRARAGGWGRLNKQA